MGHWLRLFLEVFLTVSSSVRFGGSREIRNVSMPYGINTIHLEQGFQDSQLLICYKGHGSAWPPHSPGPSGPVRVGFLAVRIVIINHMADMAEVEAATGKVGGNHDGDLIPAKTLE